MTGKLVSASLTSRNYGIDAARLISMFMVVLLHNLGHGGVLDWRMDTSHDVIFFILENASIIAVNVFGLISGYLSFGKDVKPKRALSLWTAGLFWSLSTAIIGLLRKEMPLESVLVAAFPILTKEYWYLNAFLVLQIIVPLLNAGIDRLSPREHANLALSLIASCSILGSIGSLGINNGYSVMWLMVLWIAGAAIKRNESDLRKIPSRLLITVIVVVPLITTLIEWLKSNQFGEDPTVMIAYDNPFVTLYALAFFLLSLRLSIANSWVKRMLSFYSPLAFGVYLIDSSNWFFDVWLTNRFVFLSSEPLLLGISIVIFISIAMFLSFLSLECLRQRYLFPLLGHSFARLRRVIRS